MSANESYAIYGGHVLLVSVVTSSNPLSPIPLVRVLPIPAAYVAVLIPSLVALIADSTYMTGILRGVPILRLSAPVSATAPGLFSSSLFVSVFLPGVVLGLLRSAASDIVPGVLYVEPARIHVVAGVDATGFTHGLPALFLPAEALSATWSPSPPVFLALIVSTLQLSTVTSTMGTHSIFDGPMLFVLAAVNSSVHVVPALALSIMNRLIVTASLHGKYLLWRFVCRVETDSLVPSVGVVDGQALWMRLRVEASMFPFTVVVRMLCGISNVNTSPNDDAMQIDDLDYPMTDANPQDTVDDLEPAMDVDRDV